MTPNVYELESGVVTTTPDTQKFFAENKQFCIAQTKDSGELKFFGLTTKTILTTTSAKVERINDRCIRFITQNSKIIVWRTGDNSVTLTDEINNYSHRPYADITDEYIFTFNQPLNQEQFIDWLKNNRKKLYDTYSAERHGWWENYVKIDGSGNKWKATLVEPYTD